MSDGRRLKVGFVLDDSLDKADGVQQYVLSLGEWLKQQGHDVHYLVSTSSRTDVSNVHSLARNMAVRFNGNRMSMPLPANRRRIRALLMQEQFDVLHVQVPYSPLFAQLVIALAPARTAVVGTFHVAPNGRLMTAGTTALGIWLRSSLKRFDTMLSVSTAAQSFAHKTFKIESTVLPNVVDVQRFRQAEPFVQYADTPTIMFLGRLVPRKGCQILLDAVRMLADRPALPAFRVVVCGRGPLDAKLKTFVQAEGLESKIEFTGFVTETDKPRYLRSASVAVFPSTGGESFGIVLLEAMAAGALTLGADNSGYHAVLQPRPELLFPVADAAALAERLQSFLTDPARREAAVAWQTEYVEGFDVNHVGQQLVACYRTALHKRQNVQ